MNPRFPLYIVSKGRSESRLTAKALEAMGVPYHIIVEAQERDAYAAVIDPARVLVLDPEYQRRYETCDELGDAKSKGPGAARNFAWEHSIAAGAEWHWVMDDNISCFARLHENLKVPLGDGTGFRVMEDFALRYRNLAMAGPQYWMFAPRKKAWPPYVTNTRIYSCNLIRNDLPFRWRGRYNEDTDLSLRMLKAGWCTVQFNAFLQYKMPTQTLRGGNTADFYAVEGTKAKSEMLYTLHPDVTKLLIRYGRPHHYVDYSGFRDLRLVRRPGVEHRDDAAPNDYGMVLEQIGRVSRGTPAPRLT